MKEKLTGQATAAADPVGRCVSLLVTCCKTIMQPKGDTNSQQQGNKLIPTNRFVQVISSSSSSFGCHHLQRRNARKRKTKTLCIVSVTCHAVICEIFMQHPPPTAFRLYKKFKKECQPRRPCFLTTQLLIAHRCAVWRRRTEQLRCWPEILGRRRRRRTFQSRWGGQEMRPRNSKENKSHSSNDTNVTVRANA